MTDAVSPEMQDIIRRKLAEIEHEEQAKILFAIESGSRAWGFHSPDSDYDVRFVYARPAEWHYALGKKRDVIERPIDDELDLSGWELSKTLSLMLGSNAVIAEWLQSPIVYLSETAAVAELTEFARRVLDRRSVTWHYLSLLRRQQTRLIGPDGQPRLKRFFYILRPALALRWMRLHGTAVPPMDMQNLLDGCALSEAELIAIDALTELKKQASERAAGIDVDPLLWQIVNKEIAETESWLEQPGSKQQVDYWGEASALHMRLSQAAFA